MQRRNFLKGLGVGCIAAAVHNITGIGSTNVPIQKVGKLWIPDGHVFKSRQLSKFEIPTETYFLPDDARDLPSKIPHEAIIISQEYDHVRRGTRIKVKLMNYNELAMIQPTQAGKREAQRRVIHAITNEKVWVAEPGTKEWRRV